MKKLILWLAKVFKVNIEKEVIKEVVVYKLLTDLEGDKVIEGNVVIKGNLDVYGTVVAYGRVTACLALEGGKHAN